MRIKYVIRFLKLCILALLATSLVIESNCLADQSITLISYLDQQEVVSSKSEIAAVLANAELGNLNLSAKLYKFEKIDIYLAFIKVTGVNKSQICDNPVGISFYQAADAFKSIEDNYHTLRWHNYQCFEGDESILIETLRTKIADQRSELELKKNELKETASATNRLRKDARLIAGYDRIEELKNEQQLIKEQIRVEKTTQEEIKSTLVDSQHSQVPRGFGPRQAKLTAINKELTSKMGGRVIVNEQPQIDSELYERLKGVDLPVMEGNLNRLRAERITLERSFGYAPGEFRLLQEW